MESIEHLFPRDGETISCDTSNDYDGRIGLRISAIFVILVGSTLGAILPVWARNDPLSSKKSRVPSWVFFAAKFFGSGVIVATAFIHLLAPAHKALGNPCLTGPITEYPWVEGIMLMTITVLFFLELMVMRYARFGHGHHDSEQGDVEGQNGTAHPYVDEKPESPLSAHSNGSSSAPIIVDSHNHHLDHSKDHPHDHASSAITGTHSALLEVYSAQLTSVFILEFGIIFHSIFIGLTLAVAGPEFVTLYIVVVFHQTFEGLGLGARLATIPWPKSKKWTPYILGLAYGSSTAIAIVIGLEVRNSYPPKGRTTLIVNGVFDSISAGILIYTALVELMAHEFMFSTSMRKASIRTVLSAFGLLCLGAALMALLGNWA